MKDALEQASRLACGAVGVLNGALARRRVNWTALGRAADDLEESARVLRAADPVQALIG